MPSTQCRVFDSHGDITHSLPPCDHPADACPPCEPTIADRVPIAEIMTRDLVCARADLAAAELVRLMLRGHIGCIPILDEDGRPRGMVTKTDLVELILAPQTIGTATAADVMMPFAIVVDEHATVAHCATMMALEDFHHVMIVSCAGPLIGVVSSQDVVRWLVANDVRVDG
jgi:CBS-domain-containing membrane protein